MMKKVFIAYANDNMAYSLKRIGRQAHSIGVFDEVLLWTPDMLPQYIKESPLMQYRYGGGYWAWKPCIIYETLQQYEEGTIVCYVDAGCTLRKGIEWSLWFELMKEYDTLLFKYRDEMPCWQKFGSSSTKIKYWTKKESILFYDKITGNKDWREHNKILGGCLFIKNRNNQLIKKWLDITINHPEVILDAKEGEEQFDFFAQHKHDQSLLTALSTLYSNTCLVMPELSETTNGKCAIYASRIRAKNIVEYFDIKLKTYLRLILGERICNLIKSTLMKK